MAVLARAPGVVFVSLAAALWGLDALIRKPLTEGTEVATIVFLSHVVLALLVLPLAFVSLRAVWRAGAVYVAAAVLVGVGASAVATILFTQAFVEGDPVTPVVLQKVQPLVAVFGAYLVLGERPRRGFAFFLVGGLAGVWLLAFPAPWEATVSGALPALLALAAASLWAMGTVLGRLLARRLDFEHIVTLRFLFGLPAAAVAVLVLGAPATASFKDTGFITLLAVVTGLVALSLYYYGLKRTPAATAALGELSFPVVAVGVGWLAFDVVLSFWQWLGLLLTSAVVLLLPTREEELVEESPEAVALAPAYSPQRVQA